ncbi:MAG TPA: neocarzinostatin apoprotein domain-containing protein [Acidimicrobiales bacterium]|nr:neocarzinostatin apoprotein domain-containing protein [Acidimicrobiales bacterium]
MSVVAALAVAATGVAAPAVAGIAAPAAAQQAGPTVSIDPDADLADGTQVTVDVSGMGAHASVAAVQCTAGADDVFEQCAFSDVAFGDADGAGHAALSLKVDAVLTLGDGSQEVDCRPSACAIGVVADPFDLVATATLHFDPDSPLAPPPTLTVTPGEELTDLQTVEVSGSGLVWSDFARVAQCATAPVNIFDCDFENLLEVDTRDSDSFTTDFRVSAVIATENRDVVDCRRPGACVLALLSTESTSPAKSAFAPLSFDPDTEVIVGSITVAPDHDLVDGQTVSVTGTGFPPGGDVTFSVCAPDHVADGCQWTPDFAPVDGAGNFRADVVVSAVVPSGGGEIDCRATAEPCMLVAGEGSPSSPRAARAPLHFDPDAPLLPSPEIAVEPSTNLPDVATVTVSGEHFAPSGGVEVMMCRTGSDFGGCDPQADAFLEPDGSGAFTIDLGIAARFESWEGERVDCRDDPGCEVVAEDFVRQRRATAPLTFAPLAPPGSSAKRYIDPVFDEVEVTHDVVYRDTVDAHGNPVRLKLDVYEPAGDTASRRPAVAWMHGGWFSGGDKADMADYAEAFAQRGYVAVSMEYRMRPELHCCPTRDAIGVTEALVDGREDAMAGLGWLHEHAADYRIDPRAIAVGGDGAGAANAFGLAFTAPAPGHDGGGHAMLQQGAPHEGEGPMPAAALPISGVSLDRPAEGSPPVLAFHGSEDSVAPLHLTEANCARAEAAGSHCEAVAYQGAFDDIAFTRQRDIIRRSVDFLADTVLEPLGYLEGAPQQPTTTTTSHGPSGPATTVTSPDAPKDGGRLPRTGSDARPLLWTGFGLAGLGVAALVARRLVVRRRRGRLGATLLVVVLVGGLVGAHDAAATEPTGDPADPASTSQATTPTTIADPPAGDPAPGTTVVTEPAPPVGQPTPTTAVPAEPMPDPTAPGEMPPPAPEVEDPGHADPAHDFPADWTPEQVAFATKLIADTEMALERYRNPAILGLLGYVWITDGTQPNGYQHWINTGWIGDQFTLNPEFPESLVFRNAADGPVLEAAMYMLGLGHTMDTIPEDIAWLPGWHVHTNLCFEGLRLVGIAVDGRCERGAILVPPPMVHVWIVDTPCGRFPGVDEHGLMCDPEHPGGHG